MSKMHRMKLIQIFRSCQCRSHTWSVSIGKFAFIQLNLTNLVGLYHRQVLSNHSSMQAGLVIFNILHWCPRWTYNSHITLILHINKTSSYIQTYNTYNSICPPGWPLQYSTGWTSISHGAHP